MTPVLKRLVDDFAFHTIAQNGIIMRGGSARVDNSHAKKCFKCWQRLYRFGGEGIDALTTLLSHENLGVRGVAAAVLLKHRES